MGSNEEVHVYDDTVLVTGFGPFGVHAVNASNECVKLLPSLGLERELGIRLITKEIPVDYQYVQSNVPKFWETYKPKLVVHVGVSGIVQVLTLEAQAFNTGYSSLDITGLQPKNGVCVEGCSDSLQSSIDMRKICESINNSPSCDVVSCVSIDPGRFLCDFIYFTSLNIDSNRTAFIHVPKLDMPYSALQLAQALKKVIAEMLEQVRENDRKQNSI